MASQRPAPGEYYRNPIRQRLGRQPPAADWQATAPEAGSKCSSRRQASGHLATRTWHVTWGTRRPDRKPKARGYAGPNVARFTIRPRPSRRRTTRRHLAKARSHPSARGWRRRRLRVPADRHPDDGTWRGRGRAGPARRLPTNRFATCASAVPAARTELAPPHKRFVQRKTTARPRPGFHRTAHRTSTGRERRGQHVVRPTNRSRHGRGARGVRHRILRPGPIAHRPPGPTRRHSPGASQARVGEQTIATSFLADDGELYKFISPPATARS